MDKRLEEYFVKTYPNLFRDMYGDMRKTCMAWGCSCGNGWFYLMDAAFKRAEHPGVVLLQVKEKLGGLCLYWQGLCWLDPVPPNFPALTEGEAAKIKTALDTAEARSYKVCEMCGQPGKRRGGSWIFTLCDRCEDIKNSTERGELWDVSAAFGSKIAKELGLRTTCETKRDHQPDYDYKKCVICGQVLRLTPEERRDSFGCPQWNCDGTISKGNNWACDTCNVKVGVQLPVVKEPKS